MGLTAREAFKVGFLKRCAFDGLSPEQTAQSVKMAAEKLSFIGGLLDKGWDVAKGVGNAALSYGVPLALAAPPVAGGLAGYGLAKATDWDDTDIQDVQDGEILDELRRHTEDLKRRRQVMDYQKATQRTGRVFL